MRTPPRSQQGGPILVAAAAAVFFTLVWHSALATGWVSAVGLGLMMGLVVFGSQWLARRPRDRRTRC